MGDTLAAAIQNQQTIIEDIIPKKMLNDYYESGLGFCRNNQDLALMAKQIAHRYPQMRVLEISKSQQIKWGI